MRMSEQEYADFIKRTKAFVRQSERVAEATSPKKNKYNAVATKIENMRFDSKAEATFYAETKLDPEVTHIDHHVIVTLPGNIRYELDFIVWRGRTPEAVEVKGKATTEFNRMRKLFDAFHPLAPMKVLRRRRGHAGGWDLI